VVFLISEFREEERRSTVSLFSVFSSIKSMTQQLHNRVLMATVKEMMAAHEDTTTAVGSAMNSTTSGGDLHRERAGEKKRLHTSSSTSSTTSSASDQCPLLLSPKSPDESRSRSSGAGDLGLDLSLGSYPSTDSLHVLGELLCDIRRSCTTSLTSTPIISSDGEGDMTTAADTVFESKLRRSATELRAMGEGDYDSQLKREWGGTVLSILGNLVLILWIYTPPPKESAAHLIVS
jgi:hypothetical protein